MDIIFDIVSVRTFWRILLFVHFLMAVALLGLLRFRVAVIDAGAAADGQFHSAPSSGAGGVLRAAIVILYVPTFLLGTWIYIKYRTYVRIPMEQSGHWWTLGSFEFKQHVVTMGMGLLPAYWSVWRQPLSEEHASARKWVTLFLAFTVWYAFRRRSCRQRFPRGRLMTYTLEVNERTSHLDRSHAIDHRHRRDRALDEGEQIRHLRDHVRHFIRNPVHGLRTAELAAFHLSSGSR